MAGTGEDEAGGGKAAHAFRTIGELSAELGVAQHILRYWETKFPQLKPLQRAGNRRYYRPADVALARRIHRLLNEEGYTVRGVQKLLRVKGGGEVEAGSALGPAYAADPTPASQPDPQPAQAPTASSFGDRLAALGTAEPVAQFAPAATGIDRAALVAIRDRLRAALDA